jgi:type VI secretion system protein ImpL
MQLYASNQGNWGFIRLLDKALSLLLMPAGHNWWITDGLKFVMHSAGSS